MGFELENDELPIPGSAVVVYAQANKKEGVAYSWLGGGDVQDLGQGRALWTIPVEAGEHSITVTATGEMSVGSCSRSLSLVVADEVARAIPGNFSMTVRQSSSSRSKVLGENEFGSSFSVLFSNDAYKILLDDAAATSQIVCAKGRAWSIDAQGKSMEMEGIPPSLDIGKIARPGVFSIRNLSEDTILHELGDGLVRIERSEDGASSSITYDTKRGSIVSMRSDNGEAYSTTTEMSYQTIDGYLFISSITTSTSMRIAEEDYHITQIIEISNIELGQVSEEAILEGVDL
jgi:hypothetical protein